MRISIRRSIPFSLLAIGLLGLGGLLALGVSGLAHAAGFEYPDNGAEALGRGGAFTAKADDGTAIYYNPSGLADQTGLRIMADGNFVNNAVSFQRTDSLGTAIGPSVSNSGGTFVAPFVTVSYQIIPHLTVAIGVYGPPADGRYQFPGESPPAYHGQGFNGDVSSNPNGLCLWNGCGSSLTPNPGAYNGTTGPGADPQKYNLISNNIFIAYPTLALAWAPVKYVSIGLSGQMVYATTQISQASFDGAAVEKNAGSPHTTSDEVALWDTVANLSVQNKLGQVFTGILGVTVRPIDRLSIGASYRPGIDVAQSGTMTLDYSTLQQFAGAQIQGKGTTQAKDNTSGVGPVNFDLHLPGELKSGVDWSFGDGSDIELDFDYTQWSQLNQITVTPNFSVATQLPSPATTPVQQIVQTLDFQNTWALRLGGDYKIPIPGPVRLTARAGASYETSVYNGSPSATIYPQLSFPNFQEIAGALGVSAGLGPVDLVVGYTHVFEPTAQVRNAGSTMTQNVAAGSAAPPAVVVGNGNYQTSYDVVAAGLELHFL